MKNKFRIVYPLAAALIETLVFAGCGSVRYPTNYVLNFPAPAPRVAPSEALGPLVVRAFQCPQYLCDGRIVYRPRPEEVGFYEFHRWATNPSQMITQYIADTIRMNSLFKNVVLEDAGIEPAYVLRGNIERLEEVDQGGVLAVCTLSAELLDAQNKSVVWRYTASEAVPVQSRNMPGVVSSLSTAASMAVNSIAKSLEDALTATRR
jgi:ABC-type uncharacterized transport system auxiliary subunit